MTILLKMTIQRGAPIRRPKGLLHPDSGGAALDSLTHLDCSLLGEGLSRALGAPFGCRDQGLAVVDHLLAGGLEQKSALNRFSGQHSRFLAAQVALLTCYV